MKKIYCFESQTPNLGITLDEFQTDPERVTIKLYNENDILLLHFERSEFDQLCNMRYRLDFPVVEITAQSQELTLVA